MTFTGIPAEAFDFYDALVADNSKAFWTDHKDDYEAYVREPMLGMSAVLEPSFGSGHLYRPYRDVRFSKDKTPYKDHQGLFVESRNGLGWYLQISRSGLMAAGGWYTSTSEQVSRFRDAVADDEAGRLQSLLDAAAAAGLTVGGTQLKTRPRGIDPEHPRVELLRYRSLYLSHAWEPAPWMGTPECADRVRDAWRAMTPTMEWLADTVGPGEPPVGSARNRRSR
jgi:uncharacterized protein (TIGR02453 family)